MPPSASKGRCGIFREGRKIILAAAQERVAFDTLAVIRQPCRCRGEERPRQIRP